MGVLFTPVVLGNSLCPLCLCGEWEAGREGGREERLRPGDRPQPLHYWTTILPVMALPWMAQSYWYVPGVVNMKVYVISLPVLVSLLVKLGSP